MGERSFPIFLLVWIYLKYLGQIQLSIPCVGSTVRVEANEKVQGMVFLSGPISISLSKRLKIGTLPSLRSVWPRTVQRAQSIPFEKR